MFSLPTCCCRVRLSDYPWWAVHPLLHSSTWTNRLHKVNSRLITKLACFACNFDYEWTGMLGSVFLVFFSPTSVILLKWYFKALAEHSQEVFLHIFLSAKTAEKKSFSAGSKICQEFILAQLTFMLSIGLKIYVLLYYFVFIFFFVDIGFSEHQENGPRYLQKVTLMLSCKVLKG